MQADEGMGVVCHGCVVLVEKRGRFKYFSQNELFAIRYQFDICLEIMDVKPLCSDQPQDLLGDLGENTKNKSGTSEAL